MKTQTRILRNGSAVGAAKQAPKQSTIPATSAVDIDSLDMLVGGCDATDDGLWATREGGLYLWTGAIKEAPRAVSLTEAREWWNKYHKEKPYLAAPFFPEKTDAAEFSYMVCHAMNEREAAVGLLRASQFNTVEFEGAIRQAIALIDLLERRLTSHDGSVMTEPAKSEFECGVVDLCSSTAKRLRAVRDDYYAALKSELRQAA